MMKKTNKKSIWALNSSNFNKISNNSNITRKKRTTKKVKMTMKIC